MTPAGRLRVAAAVALVAPLAAAGPVGRDISPKSFRGNVTPARLTTATVAAEAEDLARERPRPRPSRDRPLERAPRPSTETTAPANHKTATPPTPRGIPRGGQLLSVTAYCLTGRMANGRATHPGAAAGNRWPLGTRLTVAGYGTVTVEDRIGHGSDLDLAMPGNCAAAVAWGRRRLEVTAEP